MAIVEKRKKIENKYVVYLNKCGMSGKHMHQITKCESQSSV